MTSTGAVPGSAQTEREPTDPTSRRAVRGAFLGLLLAMFVAMLSSTLVTAALPRMIADLGGGQTSYTWVVVGTLLALTASTPIWGKLADMMSKKLLIQTALGVYVLGSLLAAAAPHIGVVISARVVQGVGVGGMSALVQIIIADLVSPRERGRYTGYLGAAFAVATASGPLIGGVVVDSPVGWRGTFLLILPGAVLAFVVLQTQLLLPVKKREVTIDYLGGTLIASGMSMLLIWVSLAGSHFAWMSVATIVLVSAGALLILAAVYVEAKVAVEPIIPLRLFKDRTTTLAAAASVLTGVSLFAGTVYLTEYFQNARGMSPTDAGLMSLAMVGGTAVSSIAVGRRISSTGRWKRYVVGGMALVFLGFTLLGTIDGSTPLPRVGFFMGVLGLGIGATQQNLVLAVQNSCAPGDIGAASSLVGFFRSIGGAAGVSVLGALLSHQVVGYVDDGMAALGVTASHDSGHLPDLAILPDPLRAVYERAFGEATGDLFIAAAPFALLALVCVALLPRLPLRETVNRDDEQVD